MYLGKLYLGVQFYKGKKNTSNHQLIVLLLLLFELKTVIYYMNK